MRYLRSVGLLAIVLLLLSGCGGAGATQTSTTARYEVRLTIDEVGLGERTALIEVYDRAGQPISDAQVALAPVMREMGMASPAVTATPAGPGRYQADNVYFSMEGAWEVEVRVSNGGPEERATFKLAVTA